MSSGPSTYAVVSKGRTGRSTSDDLHYIVGPNDPDLAKETDPESLIALYGTDIILNGFYSSSTNNEALKSLFLFSLSIDQSIYHCLEKFKLSFRNFINLSSKENQPMNMFIKQRHYVFLDRPKYNRRKV